MWLSIATFLAKEATPKKNAIIFATRVSAATPQWWQPSPRMYPHSSVSRRHRRERGGPGGQGKALGRGQAVEPHAPVAHAQLQLRACAFVLVRAWLHLAVTDCEGGVGDGVGCVGDSFANQCHACHPGQVGRKALQGTLKHLPLAILLVGAVLCEWQPHTGIPQLCPRRSRARTRLPTVGCRRRRARAARAWPLWRRLRTEPPHEFRSRHGTWRR